MHSQLSRREIFVGAGAGALLAAMPAAAQQDGDASLSALLARQFEEGLALAPEMATFMGIDNGSRASLRGRLRDHSASGVAATRRLEERHLKELRAVPEGSLSPEERLEREVAIYQIEAHAAVNAFPYHSDGLSAPGPYGPTQLATAYLDTAQFLRDVHPINDQADAEAYMARMGQLAGVIDAETAHVRRNAAAGIVAPRFVVEQTIAIMNGVRDTNPAEEGLVRSIGGRVLAQGLDGYAERAEAIFITQIRPALARQVEALQGVLPHALDEAGVGRLPDGRAYYEAALRHQTTSRLTADEVHRMGLDLVATISAQIDELLKSRGLTTGSLKARAIALAAAPGQAFPNTDEGRAAIIAYLNERVEAVKTRLPQVFGRHPRNTYEIRRLSPEMEEGVPGGFVFPGAADGSRPGIFYINLRDTADWPRHTLPTLAFHEAAPGHLFEGALQLESGELPLYRRGWFFSGFSEGWGLYAEQVADELGMYEDDPEGRVGYLLSHLWRAARLVVDTGLHVHGWDRARAIDYLYENSSLSRSNAQAEVDRYIVMPGQACGYMIGHATITRLRDEARRRPGFDLGAFHDFVLAGGALPMEVLERRVRAWSNT